MTCIDCGIDTLTNGVCTKCSDHRFYDYLRLKESLEGNLMMLKRCQELGIESELRHLKAIRHISGLQSYINILLDGDPETEEPLKILEFFNKEFKNLMKEDHQCKEFGCRLCDPNDLYE